LGAAFAVAACGRTAPLPEVVDQPEAGGAGGAGAATGTAGGAAGAIAGTAGGAASAGAGGAAGGATAGTGGAEMAMCGSATKPDGTCVTGAFKRPTVCQCQDGLPCVCGGACVDIANDDENCGACGRSCQPTSTCQNGVCGPIVQSLLLPTPGCDSMDLAISGDTLYWRRRRR
jgi:hypothetical protein